MYACQEYDAIEVCAGHGCLSRVLRFAGLRVASTDILMWDQREAQGNVTTNPMDMLTHSGMAFLVLYTSS